VLANNIDPIASARRETILWLASSLFVVITGMVG
jgi:hypothetical protein